MALSDAQLDRYARQIIIPEVGARGQEILLASRVWLVGHSGAVSMARRYLHASGLTTVEDPGTGDVDCALVVQPSRAEAATLTRVVAGGWPVVWYELTRYGYRAGIHRTPAPAPIELTAPLASPTAPRVEPAPEHAVAACDAACSVIGILLGLRVATGIYEAHLA